MASLLSDTNHFQLEDDVIRFSPSRLSQRTGQVLFAPFLRQTLERGLEHLPSRDCEAHSAGKRTFESYAQRHLLQLDASSRSVGHCSLQSLLSTLSRSRWHPGDFRLHQISHRFRRAARGASLGDVLRLGDWSNASTSFRFYHALYGIVEGMKFQA
jgi:hypothetical protein